MPRSAALLTLGLVSAATLGLGAAPRLAAALGELEGHEHVDLPTLRTQVDTAAADLEAERAAARDELAALRAERIELQRQVRAEENRAKTLAALHTTATERARALETEANRWHAPVRAALAEAREHVELGLPFAQAERLSSLERIERDLATASPDYAGAVSRLLRFIEEEEAMGGEIALTPQQLEFDGQRQVVDVLRLGMAIMYLRTRSGRYGWAYPTGDGWRIEPLDDPALVDAVAQRFTAHEDNRRLGPAALVLPAEIPLASDEAQ